MNDLVSDLVQQLPEALQFLEQCVSLESPSFDKRLVDELVEFIGSRFADIGGKIEYVKSDRFGNQLLARFPGKTDQRILLLGHTDTVWPAGEIEKRRFKVDAGKAFGPGVFDMKSGIVLIWMALRAVRNIKGGFTNPVTVLLNSDEEIGSTSSRDLIGSEASRCRAVFVMEPSLPGGVLKTARKGVGHFTIKAIGKAAHAGIDPLKGINAVEEIARQIIKLQQMTDFGRGTTVSVGLVKGGTRSNVVPAEAAADVDVRITSLKEADRITSAIKALTPELAGARLEIRGSINRPPMERSSETVRLLDAARRVGAQLGMDIQEGSTGGASDGNLTSALGIPTLDGLGAVGDGAHAIEEWIEIDSLPQRAALLAGLIEEPWD